MTKLENLKERVGNYHWMTFTEYKNLKKEILELDDDSICNMYATVMDSIDEKETEIRHGSIEAELELNSWYKRTKYFYKLNSDIANHAFDLYEKELNKPIEQQLAESSDEIILKMNEYEVGELVSPKVKKIVEEQIKMRGL